MKRILFAIGAFLVMFTIASFCEAGEVKAKKSQEITITGGITLDSVFANRQVNTVIYGPVRVPPPPPGVFNRQKSATFSDPTITLNLDVLLKKHVNAFLSLKTPEYIPDDMGTQGLSRVFEIDQAYVHIDEFGYKELSLRLGIQEITYDFLGNGHPFFFAIGRCEDAFPTPGTSNVFQTPGDGLIELNGPGLASWVEAGGVKLSYSKKKERLQFTGDFLFATTNEVRQGAPNLKERDMFALVASFATPGETDYHAKIMFTLANMSLDPSSRIWTLGVSSAFIVSKSVELFGEAYSQSGTYWDHFDPAVDPPGNALSSRARSILHQAFGGYAGFKYTPENSGWHFGMEWWWLSGDSDRDDRKQQNFVSYEDVDDTIILEENNYGYDLDTNYSAVKARLGIKLHKDLEFSVLYSNFRTACKVERTPTAQGFEKIGDELDFRLKWDYTEDVTFRAGIGFLWNTKFFKPLFELANAKLRTHELIFVEAVLRF